MFLRNYKIPLLNFSLCFPLLSLCALIAASAQSFTPPRIVAQLASGQINACAYSPDSLTVLTGGREAVLRLWDVATGDEVQSISTTARITRILISADNQRALTLSSLDESTTIQLWDLASGKELARLPASSAHWLFGYSSADLSTIAITTPAGEDEQGKPLPAPGSKIQIWNLLTGKEIQHYITTVATNDSSLLSPDGNTLFTADSDGPRLWQAHTGKLLAHFTHSEVTSAAAFSPDGQFILWGTIQGTAYLANIASAKEIRNFASNDIHNFMGSVESVSLSADGHQFLTASNEGNARIWDVTTGKQLHKFAANDSQVNSSVNCAAFSPDALTLLTGADDQTARLININSGKEIHRLVGYADPVAALAFTANGHGILTVSRAGLIALFGSDAGMPQPQPLIVPTPPAAYTNPAFPLPPMTPGGGRYISPIRISTDNRFIFLNGYRGNSATWELENGRLVFNLPTGNSLIAADFSADGSKLLTNGSALNFSLWNLKSGNEIQHFTINPGFRPKLLYPEGDYRAAVANLALSPDGLHALTADSEGSIRLWDTNSGRELWSLKVKTYNSLAVAFSPDGKKFLTQNLDGSAELRELKSRNSIQHIPVSIASGSVAPIFSADGHRLLIGNSLWDLDSAKVVHHFDTPLGTTPVWALSPDGHRLLIGTSDGTTSLFDADSGELLAHIVLFQNGSALIFDSAGHFDTNNLGNNIIMHQVTASAPFKPMQITASQNGAFVHDLMTHILAGEKLPPVQSPARLPLRTE